MSTAPAHKPIVHFVGSIPLPDAETTMAMIGVIVGDRHGAKLPRRSVS